MQHMRNKNEVPIHLTHTQSRAVPHWRLCLFG
jgi:hypothetical protein